MFWELPEFVGPMPPPWLPHGPLMVSRGTPIGPPWPYMRRPWAPPWPPMEPRGPHMRLPWPPVEPTWPHMSPVGLAINE